MNVCLAACGGHTIGTGGVPDQSGAASGGAGGVEGAIAGGAQGGAVRGSGGGIVTGGGGFGAGGLANGGFNGGAGFAANGGAAASGQGGFVQSDGGLGVGGASDAGYSDATDGSATIPNPCNFTFAVTTVTYNGRFAPHNIGAIWIEDSNGLFVKTLHVWGTFRLSSALEWESVSAGNTVDAITSASRTSEGPITGAWNCTNVSHAAVPKAGYLACVEVEEDANLPGLGIPTHYTCLPFPYGGGSASGVWPDEPIFVSMSWTFE